MNRRQRRRDAAEIGRRRPAGNQAEIGNADCGMGAGRIDAGRINENEIERRALQPIDHAVELVRRHPCYLGRLAGSRLSPLRDGSLLVHFQDADRVAGLLGGDGERCAQRALAAASLLRNQRNYLHFPLNFPLMTGRRDDGNFLACCHNGVLACRRAVIPASRCPSVPSSRHSVVTGSGKRVVNGGGVARRKITRLTGRGLKPSQTSI